MRPARRAASRAPPASTGHQSPPRSPASAPTPSVSSDRHAFRGSSSAVRTLRTVTEKPTRPHAVARGAVPAGGASSPPRVTSTARRHRSTGSSESRTSASAASRTALTATTTDGPAGGARAAGSAATANPHNAAAIRSATSRNRRAHPRAVPSGTPTSAATRRWPHPERPPPARRRSSPRCRLARPPAHRGTTSATPHSPRTPPDGSPPATSGSAVATTHRRSSVRRGGQLRWAPSPSPAPSDTEPDAPRPP